MVLNYDLVKNQCYIKHVIYWISYMIIEILINININWSSYEFKKCYKRTGVRHINQIQTQTQTHRPLSKPQSLKGNKKFSIWHNNLITKMFIRKLWETNVPLVINYNELKWFVQGFQIQHKCTYQYPKQKPKCWV